MQLCQTCQKEIKYIAITKDQVVCCDAEEQTAYTYTGREIKVYVLHKCKIQGENNENVEQQSVN